MFLLCSYIDSDRWPSAIEPLLYPRGLTFYRPFSYRTDYFLPNQLVDQLADRSQMSKLLGTQNSNNAIFGVRFRKQTQPDFRQFFVPLRKVTLLSSERKDEINIRFQLGDFVKPVVSGDGTKSLPKLDLAALVGSAGDAKLFLQLGKAEQEVAEKWTSTPDFPQDFWDALLGSLSTAARQQVKDTVVLRLDGLKARGKGPFLAPEEIDSERPTRGYKLRQGTTYDVNLYYKRLVEKGVEPEALKYFFVLSNPTQEFQASRRSVRVMGNYRSEEIWIQPETGTPGPIELAFEPARIDEAAQIADQASSKMIGLKVPISVKAKLCTAPRLVNLILSFTGLVGILWSLRVYLHDSPSDATRKVLELFIAALASVVITSVKDLFIQDH
jgi:hypothetical protein